MIKRLMDMEYRDQVRAAVQRLGYLNMVLMGIGLLVLYGFVCGRLALLTGDQQGYRLFRQGRFEEAAERFTGPMWQAAALFRQGDFKQAADLLSGYDTAEAVFNHGNSLVMLGKYEEAVRRYARALELRPDWQEAAVNLEIARARAELLKKEGGLMTGGKLAADEVVFGKKKSAADIDEEQSEVSAEMGDAEIRAMWLRTVRTSPADFLRAKFAYQHAAVAESAAEELKE